MRSIHRLSVILFNFATRVVPPGRAVGRVRDLGCVIQKRYQSGPPSLGGRRARTVSYLRRVGAAITVGMSLTRLFALVDPAAAGDSSRAVLPGAVATNEPQFAILPVPDPADEGGQGFVVSGDGSTMAFLRVVGGDTQIVVYDVPAGTLQSVGVGEEPGLDRLGRYITYPPDVPMGSLTIVDILAHTSVLLPDLVYDVRDLQIGDVSIVFLADVKYGDMSGENPPGTFQVYALDRSTKALRQISSAPRHEGPSDEIRGVQSLALAERVNMAAYVARPAPGAPPQVFLADLSRDSIRQVTNAPDRCHDVTISADGTTIACDSGRLITVDTNSGTSTVILPDTSDTGFGSAPKLSGDGHHLAFVSSRDLDARHLNGDGDSEVYSEDLQTGQVVQVTDTVDALAGPSLWAVDEDGGTIVIDLYGPQRANGLWPTNVRAILQLPTANRPPTVSAPMQVQAIIGANTSVPMAAQDPDGDRLQLYVDRGDKRPPNEPQGIGNILLQDRGDGTGSVEITPSGRTEARYMLRVAAFDIHGAVAIKDVTLQTVCPGDCGADGEISIADLVRLVRIALSEDAVASCTSGDADADGQIQVNEIIEAVDANLAGCGAG